MINMKRNNDFKTQFCHFCLEFQERSFQKQPTIFLNKKLASAKVTKGDRTERYTRNVGLGFKTPREVNKYFLWWFFYFPRFYFIQAIEGTYIDKKCPFTGGVSIRGRILTGTVLKLKMTRTIVIRRDYLHYVRKYNRFEKRHKNMSVHLSPCFRYEFKSTFEPFSLSINHFVISDVQIGDVVTIGECRPLSKTVRFNVLKVTKSSGSKKQFQKF